MKTFQNICFVLLCGILVFAFASLVPQTNEELLTVGPKINGVSVGPTTSVYRVTYRASLVKWLDQKDTPFFLLKNVDCTPERIRNAYIAAGYSDVEVSKLPF